MNYLDKYVNHTGGAYGVDTIGCVVGLSLGFNNHVHFRPVGNERLSKRLRVLMLQPTVVSRESLNLAKVKINSLLNKNYKGGISADLQFRNYFQVVNSDAIFCFSRITGNSSVAKGTNTALQLAIALNKDAYVFDTLTFKWYKYIEEVLSLCEIDYIPVLTDRYAIVGTRDVEDYKVLDRATGLWVSRPTYLGKDTEMKVERAIRELYVSTLDYESFITSVKECL